MRHVCHISCQLETHLELGMAEQNWRMFSLIFWCQLLLTGIVGQTFARALFLSSCIRSEYSFCVCHLTWDHQKVHKKQFICKIQAHDQTRQPVQVQTFLHQIFFTFHFVLVPQPIVFTHHPWPDGRVDIMKGHSRRHLCFKTVFVFRLYQARGPM